MSSVEETAEEDTVPSILITSSDPAFKEEELIKQILSTECLPEPVKREETVTWYPWTLNNKYYTADVRLCTVPSPFQMTAEIAQSMQAFIAYFDSTAKDGLEKLSPWISVVEDLGPEVLILVCDRVCEQGVSRHAAQQWCLAHAFELVELNPQDLPDEDDDFPESTGVKRILQALNANVWSSVEMKDEHNQGFGLMSSLVANRHNTFRSGANPPVSHIYVLNVCMSYPMTHLDIQELANLTAGDADVENFERLFTKLKEMKDKASSLPHEQRKVHAEKVAKAFWMAIGGEADEVEELSSGEES
uniref:Alpha and gamma adaptin binding protein n=1 Tax=Gadus morhua TaxID=8049 RepID=A0A8C4ZUW3_GADMO